jgi:hypothetical protein
MANQRMKESWAQMKKDIQTIWGSELSDDELEQGRRDLNKMIDVIHSKTGKSRSQIRSQIMAIL